MADFDARDWPQMFYDPKFELEDKASGSSRTPAPHEGKVCTSPEDVPQGWVNAQGRTATGRMRRREPEAEQPLRANEAAEPQTLDARVRAIQDQRADDAGGDGRTDIQKGLDAGVQATKDAAEKGSPTPATAASGGTTAIADAYASARGAAKK